MVKSGPPDEPMCETSEKGERLFSRNEILPIALEIGQRILEIFGYQEISKITFRLRSGSRDVNAIVNGEVLPSVELLLGIQKITGASIDWILTGKGDKFPPLNDSVRRSLPLRKARKAHRRTVSAKIH
jgi:hypothetical protein